VRVIPEPPFADLCFIMANLRDEDRIEASAQAFSDQPEEWASRIHSAGSFQWGVYLNGTPIVSLGASPRWTGNWNAWCLGTADFPRVALTVTKFIARNMVPTITGLPDFRRADTLALATDFRTHRWLMALGALFEGPLANWGKNGETFLSFVWLREATKPVERTATASMGDDPHGLLVV
jgi:hypothetical protein